MKYKNKKIDVPWWEPETNNLEKKFVNKVLNSNYPNEGKYTLEFEKKISQMLNVKHAVCVTSGTIAIFLALKSLGIKKGDEVIVPDLTFAATANAVDLTGAKSVFVDVDKNDLNINIKEINKKISNKTKAILPVHISGRGANMKEILKIAKRKNIFVVEDAAQAFMSKHKKKYLGTWGDIGCFSFSPPKLITTGQGGIIVTNDFKINQKLRRLKDQGRDGFTTGGDDTHNTIGYNFKFTNVQAAIGLAQIFKIKKRIKRLKRNYILYKNLLKNLKQVRILNFNTLNGEIPLWTDMICSNRDSLVKFLKKKGVDTRKFYHPLHTQKPFKNFKGNFKIISSLSKKLVWLPSAFTLNDKQVVKVCNLIKKFYILKK